MIFKKSVLPNVTMATRKPRPAVQKALEELRKEPKLTDPPLRPVKSIQFGIMSPEEITGISVCEVTESGVAQPYDNTVYDERMGPAHSRTKCSTCQEDNRVCPRDILLT